MFRYLGKYNSAEDYREELFPEPIPAIDFALENIRECYEFRVINTNDYSTIYSTRMAEAEQELNILALRLPRDEE
jgi:hypothetical protein